MRKLNKKLNNVNVTVDIRWMLSSIRESYNTLRYVRRVCDLVPYSEEEQKIISSNLDNMRSKLGLIEMHAESHGLDIADQKWSRSYDTYKKYLEVAS